MKHSSSHGFGLLEVILVFAIVIGAAAVIFTIYQSAQPSADAAAEAQKVQTMATNIQATFGLYHNYAAVGTDNTQVILSKAVPAPMVASPTDIESVWGPVLVTNNPNALGFATSAQCSNYPSCFFILYQQVPPSVCFKFVTGLAGSFPQGIGVNRQNVVANGQVNTTLLAQQCQSLIEWNGAGGPTVVEIELESP